MLATLKARGLRLAIVSSDAERNVRKALSAAAGSVDLYACSASLFGKAAKFRRVLKRAGVPAAAAIAIGDEMRDADAAAQAGIAFGAVTWGYAKADALMTKQPALVFRSMDEIAGRLAPQRG